MSDAKFTTGRPMKHVAVMSLTASIGLMAIFVVDFVDMLFISMIGQAELAAAIGYAGTLLFFTTSFGIGFGIAAGALVSRALGEDNLAGARDITTYSLLYGLVFGGLFAALVWIFVYPLLGLLGAEGEIADLAAQYLRIIVPSLPILVMGIIGGAVLRAHGAAARAMYGTIFGGVANAILGPILIFGAGLDLMGAAIASVVARFIIAGYSLWVVGQLQQGFARPSFAGFKADLRPVFVIAFPAILTQLATPIGSAYVTREMAQFGEEAIAGMAIVGRLVPLAFGLIFALSGAVGPIIGQNFGAGLAPRVRRTFWDAVIFSAGFTVLMSALLFLLRGQIADVFHAENDARDLLYAFAGPLALLFFFNGVLFIANAAFNNLGHPYYSTWLNWGRHTVGTIPFVIVGASYGPVGVLAGQYIGRVIFGLIAAALAVRLMNKGGAYCEETVKKHRLARGLSLLHARR
jgi:putative MATE family efflux protein